MHPLFPELARSPRRQVGEPQTAAIPHAESHLGIAPADGKEGKDYVWFGRIGVALGLTLAAEGKEGETCGAHGM